MGALGFVIVFVGAGLGGMARHGMNIVVGTIAGTGFPMGTLVVNVSGCFIMAIIAEYFAQRSGLPQEWRLFLTTGVLGGYTTFSAFSLDTVLLVERGQLGAAVGYAAASVFVSLGAFLLGLMLVRALLAGAS